MHENGMKPSVLVTGASKGTGLAIARRFAEEGYGVFVTSRRLKDAQETASLLHNQYGVYTMGLKLEPADEGDIERAFAQITQSGYTLKALVLNAADLGIGMPALSTSVEDWARVINTNLVWNFEITQAAARLMTAHGGSIVFIGSNTSVRAISHRSAYIASKGGLSALTKALAIELGEYGIRVNCVLSGSIQTERFQALPKETQESKKRRVPLRNIADFEDIANAVWFLADEVSKNITGADIPIDGGACAQLFPNQ